MRPSFTFAWALLCCTGLASAQSRSALGGNAGALGGTAASSHPLGGVALPTFPSAANARRKKTTPSTTGFTPIFYIPNYYDTSYDTAPSNYLQTPPPPAPQTIVINQYFNSRGPDDRAAEDDRQPAPPPEDIANPGDPIGEPRNYYLIAYRDRTVYPALAYWVEGDTLHYVTTQNTHNQASLALIDLDRTTTLNADRAIPFSIPGR